MTTNQQKSWGETFLGLGIIVGVILAVCLVGLIIFRITCVTLVDNYKLGYTFDRFSGKVEKLDRTGWIVRNPFRYSVHAIDLRPHQIQITANKRVLNAKLVEFNPKGLEKFVEWHGRGAGETWEATSDTSLTEILKAYAFNENGGKDCPFLTIVNELGKSGFAATNSPTGAVR